MKNLRMGLANVLNELVRQNNELRRLAALAAAEDPDGVLHLALDGDSDDLDQIVIDIQLLVDNAWTPAEIEPNDLL